MDDRYYWEIVSVPAGKPQPSCGGASWLDNGFGESHAQKAIPQASFGIGIAIVKIDHCHHDGNKE